VQPSQKPLAKSRAPPQTAFNKTGRRLLPANGRANFPAKAEPVETPHPSVSFRIIRCFLRCRLKRLKILSQVCENPQQESRLEGSAHCHESTCQSSEKRRSTRQHVVIVEDCILNTKRKQNWKDQHTAMNHTGQIITVSRLKVFANCF
jgi:hypothetical protein